MDDLISRQAAIDALGDGAMVNYQAAGHDNGLIKAISVIKGLPSAQLEPRKGRWTTLGHLCQCTACEHIRPITIYPMYFCPNCGAKMEESDE